jgi:hypothetical protein
MFSASPHHIGGCQQSVLKQRLASNSRPTLLCSASDIHHRIHCISILQGSWSAAIAAGTTICCYMAPCPNTNCSRCCLISTQCPVILRCVRCLSMLKGGQTWEVCAPTLAHNAAGALHACRFHAVPFRMLCKPFRNQSEWAPARRQLSLRHRVRFPGNPDKLLLFRASKQSTTIFAAFATAILTITCGCVGSEGQGQRNVVRMKEVSPLKTEGFAYEQALFGPSRRLNVFADEPSSAPSPGVCVPLL